MKKIINISIAAMMLVTVACQKFLTVVPSDQQVIETYYTSEEAIDANTASLYANYVWQDFSINFMWMAGDELSGDLFYTYAEEGQFYYMTFTSTNTFLNAGWNGLYRVVSYCNNIINNMPDAARANNIDEAAINKGLAEARCIRAIAYYFLTEYWENVPIIDNNNVQSNDIVRHKQSSVYEFMRRDLEFAKANLPERPAQAGRCSKWTAVGMLAKLHLTMASHGATDNYETAKNYALEVINSGLVLYPNLESMFYPEGNNSDESLFAIQCTQDGYAYGNPRNVSLSRNSNINLGNSWGAGKGATLSLQDAFESGDRRRKNTFMRQGDSYDRLAGGGYTYANYSPDGAAVEETPNEMLCHVRKYVVGANADCGGKAGATNQDAGNNIYLLRLSDVYLVYVEACIGSGSSTSDAKALEAFRAVRERAGLLWSESSITYEQLIKERRTEFAFESINFFDVKRMSYRDPSAAVAYLQNMQRHRQYISNLTDYTKDDHNVTGAYHGGSAIADPENESSIFYINPNISPLTFTAANLVLPIPDETVAKTPRINEDPVDYNF
ncbi:MAG: RagB/SusD family nutrient uptake outer membrane protein [Bacteroidales bacterium]|nr:RagB/SusD family nutrient uptake outer membrane protein [Bacteroidales bacterium]